VTMVIQVWGIRVICVICIREYKVIVDTRNRKWVIRVREYVC
jgi:hypothetical protein